MSFPSRLSFPAIGEGLRASLAVAGVVFVLAVVGIFTRPQSDLAAFWPANAFMLGMLIRFPGTATLRTWGLCALAFLAADAMAGTAFGQSVFLNTGNLVAVAAGYAVLWRIPADARALRSTGALLAVVSATGFSAVMSALFGAMGDPLLFGGTPSAGFVYWGATELVNMIAFLPMLLALPDHRTLASLWKRCRQRSLRRWLRTLLPLAGLVSACVGSVLVGGPGAVAFPVPMLLWCALVYPVFFVACLGFFYVAWALLAISTGLMPVGLDFDTRPVLLSVRVGVALVALAPLAVASAMAERNDLVMRLRHLALHDPLTGLANRAAFFQRAPQMLQKMGGGAVLMLDIDRFKAVNDDHGHQAGDEVLRHFAAVLEQSLRPRDLAARLGGEEFVVLVQGCNDAGAMEVAQRIRTAFSDRPFTLSDGTVLSPSVSVGIAVSGDGLRLEDLLVRADAALYRAKLGGRNRVEMPAASG